MSSPRLLGIATALAILSACADGPTQPEVIDPSLGLSANRTVKMVPFKGTNTNTPTTPAPVCPTGELPVKLATAGTASHLGAFTGGVSGCVHPVSGTYSSLFVTFTGANGDEVWSEMDPNNVGQIVFFDPSTGELVTEGGLIIVGGSGRFEGATGYIEFHSAGNFFVPGSAITTMSGEISSPGSIKWTP